MGTARSCVNRLHNTRPREGTAPGVRKIQDIMVMRWGVGGLCRHVLGCRERGSCTWQIKGKGKASHVPRLCQPAQPSPRRLLPTYPTYTLVYISNSPSFFTMIIARIHIFGECICFFVYLGVLVYASLRVVGEISIFYRKNICVYIHVPRRGRAGG